MPEPVSPPPPAPPTSACLDDPTVAALAGGRLDAAAHAEAEGHLAECAVCMAIVAVAARRRGRERDAGAADEPSPPAPPDAPSQAWTPPETVEEFRLVRLLGEGAMGQVYLAHDTLLERQVAVKFITGLEVSAMARERFLREARAVARLAHPNVVTLYRVGEAVGRPFLVSEYVRGTPLDELPRPMPTDALLAIALDLARGLAAAHREGVLHRDIKPANAIRAENGTVKILDFGLAKLGDTPTDDDGGQAATPLALAAAGMGLTATGVLLGTPRYMSPERWRSEPATPQTDLFAVGAVLYELAAGRPAFPGETLVALAYAILAGPPEPLSTTAPDLSPALAAVIMDCLKKDPAERPRDGDALLEALARVALPPAAAPAPRPRWRLLAVLGAASVLAALLPLFFLFRHAPAPAGPVALPGGLFTMGSTPEEMDAAFYYCQQSDKSGQCDRAIFEREQPLRTVRLSPFHLDATEVTNARFAEWLNRQPQLREVFDEKESQPWIYDGETPLANLYPTLPSYGLRRVAGGRLESVPGFAERPVTQVTWFAASRYCEAHGQRLPTEAEWEYAARPHPGDRFPWGSEPPRCDGVVFGRLKTQECDGLAGGPSPVGTSSQDVTPQGIYDLAGNVAEWVRDRFVARYPACDGECLDPVVETVAEGGPALRMFRGGDWRQVGAILRSAGRGRRGEHEALENVGFRCASR